MSADLATITQTLGLLTEAGSVFEIRIPKAGNKRTVRGYFDDPAAAAREAAKWSGKVPGIYITPNPVNPELLARACNRMEPYAELTASDADITARRWLMIDIDPVRAGGISASDAEHDAAQVKAAKVREWLTAQSWPEPILADSGNGAHLLYRIDLPNNDAAKVLVKTCLEALAGRFDDRNGQSHPVKIDLSVFNASRIWKLYGTASCKGDSTTDRPHRVSRLIDVPAEREPVHLERLNALSAMAPKPEVKARPEPGPGVGGDFFKTANDQAMRCLSGWIPILFPDARPYRDGFRVTSQNLRRDLEEDLSILPEGIKDFGVADQGDASGGRRTPIDLVMEYGAARDAKDAALQLCRWLGVDPATLGWRKAERQQAPPNPGAGASAKGDGPALTLSPYRGTDDSNATLFLETQEPNVRYCPGWAKWLVWVGGCWRLDSGMDVDRMAADLPRQLLRRAGDSADKEERRTIADLAKRLERAALRKSMIEVTRHRVVVLHEDLDCAHHLLNANNGTIDLATGRLRDHDRADLLTHTLGVDFDPQAPAPTWQRFLFDVFAGDQSLIDFVRRAIGYSLTGSVKEQALFICHGVGSNGKSVFLNILRTLLGRLAWQAAPDLLLQDRHRRHPTEQADLHGKRLIVCQETGEGRRFNEVMVKQLTGGDAITARRMHEDFWTFNPTHKIWLSTNHRPEIRGTDHAIWRRVRLIPFNVRFAEDSSPRKDPDMEAKLLEELPGILAWAVAGCLDWQKHGLGMADAVKAATDAYQADMDVLAGWMADCCVIARHCDAKASALYASYRNWCEANGETSERQRSWGMRLTERGFERFSRNGTWYRGIGLRAEFTEGTEGTEPKKAVLPLVKNAAQKNCISGSVGSVGSVGVCAGCASFAPTPEIGGGVCNRHEDSVDHPDVRTCDQWEAA